MTSRYRMVLLMILLLAFGVRLHRMTELGTQADEGVHIVVAEQMAAGRVLYRELFENRTPGLEWLLAGLFRLSGADLILARVVGLGLALLTVASLQAAGQALGSLLSLDSLGRLSASGKVIAILASLSFALSPLPVFWSRFAMTEHLQAAAAILSITFALRGLVQPQRSWWMASGLMAGLAVIAKQSGLVIVFVFLLYLAALLWKYRWRHWLGPAVIWLVGLTLPLLVLLLVLVIQDAKVDFLHFLSGVERFASWQLLPERLVRLSGWVLRQPVLFLALPAAIISLWRWHIALALPLMWAGAEMTALMLPADFEPSWGGYSHYVIPVVVSFSLLAAGGLVWGWLVMRDVATHKRLLPAGLMLLLVVTLPLPSWMEDLGYAIRQIEYPQSGFSPETRIGRAASLVTEEEESILVLANAIFYHRANREPSNLFFHYPEYLSNSSLASEAEIDIMNALGDPNMGAILVSKMYLDERLSPAIASRLWSQWQPAAVFPYPYQRDVFLFLPRPELHFPGAPALASFEMGVDLAGAETLLLDPQTLLVRLIWSAQDRLSEEYTVFVHVLAEDGALVAQHDGPPVVAFRPTNTWRAEELIVDWHWIDLPTAGIKGDFRVSIGLYRSDKGQRLFLQDGTSEINSFTIFEGKTS